MLNKWLNLCRKAGAVAVGDTAVKSALTLGDARLILLASDAGAVAKKIETLAARGGVRVLDAGAGKEELGQLLGRGTAAVAAITNRELAGAILKEYTAQEGD
jgi:ribosomal protein L7Ae-like RNA K-turn-binding protein